MISLPDLPEAAASNTEGCPAFKNMFSHCKKTKIQISKKVEIKLKMCVRGKNRKKEEKKRKEKKKRKKRR